jgi:hypothetical protein
VNRPRHAQSLDQWDTLVPSCIPPGSAASTWSNSTTPPRERGQDRFFLGDFVPYKRIR